MTTIVFSVMHMVVDSACAYAMFGQFMYMEQAAVATLIYNFCAFALQFPIGAVYDVLLRTRWGRKVKLSAIFAAVGTVLIALGMLYSPIILGLGNAFFHIGGGTAVGREDLAGNKKGSLLGIFVAPGALGLFLGSFLSGITEPQQYFNRVLVYVAILIVLTVILFFLPKAAASEEQKGTQIDFGEILILAMCFSVVIIRSMIGFYVGFEWKAGFAFSLVATIALVAGKLLGGIVSARFGTAKTVGISLAVAALSFMFKDILGIGVVALIAFNMTMPITLYIIIKRHPGWIGSCFGLLTVALFVGFVPYAYGVELGIDGRFIGLIGSLVSLVLLFGTLFLCRRKGATDGAS